jgi:HK97 family phage prohead protease
MNEKRGTRAERQYRNFSGAISLRDADGGAEGGMTVAGYAAVWGEPYPLFEIDGATYYEKISRNALDGADISDVVLRYDHEGKVLARTSNGTLSIFSDDTGLEAKADLSKSDAARQLHEEIKNGLVTKMSWAFTVVEFAYDKKTRTEEILKVGKVYDVSAVTFPANDKTSISARCARDGEIARARAERLLRRIMIMQIENTLEGK